MLVFVDESGDTGLKLERNSSRYFVVTVILFKDREEAVRCDRAIERLARRRKRAREYHFVETTHAVRQEFFECVREFGFVYASIVMNKAKLDGEGFKHKEPFMKCAIRYAFSHIESGLNDAIVVVDRTGNRDFRHTLKRYLKKRVVHEDGSSRIKKVRTEKSHSNRLIQLADMVCGAVSRSYGDKKEPARYRKMIGRKEVCVQFWPT